MGELLKEDDLEIIYLNSSNLARKGEIRQYPSEQCKPSSGKASDRTQTDARYGRGAEHMRDGGYGRPGERKRDEGYARSGERKRDGGYGRPGERKRDEGYGRPGERKRDEGYGRPGERKRDDGYGASAAGRHSGGNGRMMRQENAASRRNPYLVNYAAGSRTSSQQISGRDLKREMDDIDMIWGQEARRPERQRPEAGPQRQPSPKERGGYREAAPEVRRTASNAGQAVGVNRRHPAVAPVSRSREVRRAVQARRRQQALRRKLIMGALEVLVIVLIGILVFKVLQKPEQTSAVPPLPQTEDNSPVDVQTGSTVQGISREAYEKHPQWEEDFLTPNEYSRPGDPLGTVTNIFVHYTANPGTSAKQNRSYFEQLKDTQERSASSHFIIGYDGEIIQCVPLDEIAYAVMTRNEDSISIECCYKSEDGSFTQETYDSLIALLSWLTETYGLDSEDILRHYDCGGKKCPIYYTENEDAWERLKADVRDYTL